MSKERRLGRGLEALLGRPAEASADEHGPETAEFDSEHSPPAESSHACTRSEDGQQWLALDAIQRNPYQPRQHFDESEIADLCDSIRAHGFLQPIVVREFEGCHQIIAGERRYRAAQLAGWEKVPVQIRQVDDRQMAELAIVENVQRKDLNPLEKAGSFQRYLQEYGCTQEELAARVNIDRSTVANLIRLLELPEAVKQMILEGELTQGHARALLPLGDEHEQQSFAKRVKNDSLSVRATEELVQDHIRSADGESFSIVDENGNSRPPTAAKGASEHLRQLEEQLKFALGTKVDLRQTAKGRGRITIHFKDHEEFERIQALLVSGQQAVSQVG